MYFFRNASSEGTTIQGGDLQSDLLGGSMNRYFFDVYNSDGPVLDDDGQFLESRDRARAEALRILHDIARDEMPDRDLVKLTVKVRGDGGAQMFEASLILTSGWSA